MFLLPCWWSDNKETASPHPAEKKGEKERKEREERGAPL